VFHAFNRFAECGFVVTQILYDATEFFGDTFLFDFLLVSTFYLFSVSVCALLTGASQNVAY